MSITTADRIAYLQALNLLGKLRPVAALAAQFRAGGLRLVADSALGAALETLAAEGNPDAQLLRANLEVNETTEPVRTVTDARLERAVLEALRHLPADLVQGSGLRLRNQLEALLTDLRTD